MARHGKDTVVYLSGYAVSEYLNEASQPQTSNGVSETTTFLNSSKTFIPSTVDATYSLSGLFDGSANAIDEILSTALNGTNQDLIVLYDGDEAGKTGYATRSLHTSYEITAPVEDVVSVSASAQSNVGIDRITVLEAMGAETVTGESSELDSGASSANGAVLYLQVTDVTGTFAALEGLTVSVEHATSSGGAFSSIGDFTLVDSSNQHERLTVSGTINQFVKATWTIDGTTPSFSLFVAISRG